MATKRYCYTSYSSLLNYANSPEMAKQYIKLNAIKHIHIFKNFYDNFCVWEMHTQSIGLPVGEYATKREALVIANKVSEISGLPVK